MRYTAGLDTPEALNVSAMNPAQATRLSLELQDLSCARGDRTLFSALDYRLSAGELLYVAGRNGAGKTTLLRAMAGLLMPRAGEIRWCGANIRGLREDYSRHLLFLGHLNAIKADLTAEENLRVSAALDGFRLDRAGAWRALQQMGLKGHEDIPTKYLSQGQKRRVALARLLISRAALWILDEPFTALDAAAVAQLQQVMRDHLDNGGMVALTTHQAVDLTSGAARTLVLGEQHAG